MINRLLILSLFTIGMFTVGVTGKNTETVNAVIGDESFFKTFHRLPNQYDSEELRIKTHLRLVLEKLHQADNSKLSNTQLENRLALLSHLSDYINAGEFPVNEYSIDSRRPNFIDSQGNICAVGYLVEQTSGRETAELLSSFYQFEYIMNMESELLDEWLEENGLSKMEAAMIQPAYRGIEPIDYSSFNSEVSQNYSISTIGLLSYQTLLVSGSYFPSIKTKTQAHFSAIASGLGTVSMISGIYYLNEAKQRHPISDVVTYNDKQRNLSLFNIAIGLTSTVYNGFRALHLYKEDRKPSNFKLYSSMQPLIGSPELVPSLHLSYSF